MCAQSDASQGRLCTLCRTHVPPYPTQQHPVCPLNRQPLYPSPDCCWSSSSPLPNFTGGQKARVVFTAIALSRPHILLLDEPTNHLDMQSIDALCDALDEFEGGVVVISHDSQLLSRLCADEERSEVWIVDDGKINFYNGDFDDYRNELIREINAELDEDEAEA